MNPFEKILERLEEQQFDIGCGACPNKEKCDEVQENINDEKTDLCAETMRVIAKQIVQEVAEEFATDTNVGTNGWIPCSERLPSGLDFVLYTCKDGEVDICSIEYFYDYLDKFTAWQPLPEPFQKGDNNENS